MSRIHIIHALASAPMSRDSAVKLGMIGMVLLANAVLLPVCGMQIESHDLVRLVGVLLLLGAVAVWYQQKGEREFVMCLLALIHLVAYSAVYAVMSYCVATSTVPLADPLLIRMDAALGVHVPSIADWMDRTPSIAIPLSLAYGTVLWQTEMIVAVLGFSAQRRALETFVMQFMITTVVAAFAFAAFPAYSPSGAYDELVPTGEQQRFLDHMQTLRSGERTVIGIHDAEGLITIPSFHTTWAILMAWAVREQRYVRLPLLLLNVAVIVSTVSTGWHYFVDVLAGILLAIAGILIVRRMEPWLYDVNDEPVPAGGPLVR